LLQEQIELFARDRGSGRTHAVGEPLEEFPQAIVVKARCRLNDAGNIRLVGGLDDAGQHLGEVGRQLAHEGGV
jgi:hypothetical protein